MFTKALELSRAFGYLYEDEVRALQVVALALDADNPVIINIGAGVGTSALSFREARPEAVIYTIDKQKDGSPTGSLEGELEAFKNAEMEPPNQIHGDSSLVGRNWAKGMVDLVFVDGDHSEQGVESDISAWIVHIKSGGYMVFHDYDAINWSSVKLVVDRMMSGYKKVIDASTVVGFLIDGADKPAMFHLK